MGWIQVGGLCLGLYIETIRSLESGKVHDIKGQDVINRISLFLIMNLDGFILSDMQSKHWFEIRAPTANEDMKLPFPDPLQTNDPTLKHQLYTIQRILYKIYVKGEC